MDYEITIKKEDINYKDKNEEFRNIYDELRIKEI